MPRLGAIIAILTLHALTMAPMFGQGAEQHPKRVIGREDLRAALEQRARGGPVVADVIIQGDDLVALLQQGISVRVERCTIENGLIFRQIPTINTPIELVDCALEPAPERIRALWGGHSVYARGTRFGENVRFSSTIFVGQANFVQAEFHEQADFSRSQFQQPAVFSGTRFHANALFSRASFQRADFRNAAFERAAGFGLASFGAAAEFQGAVFERSANFGGAAFREAQIVAASFNGLARFKETRFQGGASFSNGTQFGDDVSFEKAWFGGAAHFRKLAFPKRTDFNEAAFRDEADFSGANFAGSSAFNAAVFDRGANFAGARFMENASFQSARFPGESDFSGSRFSKEASFVGAHFGAPVLFSSIVAERFASFRGAVFDDETSLESAVFGESADFQGATFRDRLTFTNAHFGAYADFREAKIGKLDLYSAYNPTILASRIDLRGAWLGETLIQDVIFENIVDFSDATFGLPLPHNGEDSRETVHTGATVFRFATFENDVSFARARFAGPVAMENVKFRQAADFTDASFAELSPAGAPALAVSYVDFADLRISWSQLPDTAAWAQSEATAIRSSIKKTETPAPGAPEPISRTLAKLERHFRDRNQLEDANRAYYERKLAELAEARSRGWDTRRLLLELEWLFWGLLCGYGTKIGAALAWAAFTDILFAAIYWKWATVTRSRHPGAQQEHSFRLRLLDLPKQFSTDQAVLSVASPALRKFINSLRVSSVILFKVGYRDTTISGSVGPVPMAYLIAVEWVLGYYLLAAITVTLANTQPLINRLVTGVF